jgi:hypothetical protein
MDCAKQNFALSYVKVHCHHLLTQVMRSALTVSIAMVALLAGCQTTPKPEPSQPIQGIVWQLDNDSTNARGNWHELGAKKLLLQWVAVDGISFLEGSGQTMAPQLPDWQRIAAEPWAQEVILGLAGRFDETAARADVAGLIAQSERLSKLPIPLNVVGWYFPVEVDSSWSDAKHLGPMLAGLPRPLWISVYDRANIGAEPLAAWLATWLPADVGIMFQDGVGVYARTAVVARQYVLALSQRFGQARVSVIAEAFRAKDAGEFRSATASEISDQLQTYRGLPVYLFDGPHYVSNDLVKAIKSMLANAR